ncbi:MAG: GGDEF domain-containing protein [Marinobacterium sp.]|nr:GGDEF domain-containing protein [Marinobacterium sp.]
MIVEALLDVVSARRHSRYFNQARSHYLFRRVRTIAVLMALLQPAWIAVDMFLLPENIQSDIALWRILSALVCVLLLLWTHSAYSLKVSYLRLAGLIAVLSVFQTFSAELLFSIGQSGAVAGYHFFPFMIVVMLAVFPLTVVESMLFGGAILLLELATQYWRGTLWQVDSLNNLWLLSILGIIASWASVNQLSMLLGLFRQATRDPLTGLSNRRQSMEQLEQDLKLQQEEGRPVSLLMFDLDHFKRFNDTYGHAAGDIVLREFARIMRKHARKRYDLSGRYGGEEFLMILPGMQQQKAAELAQRIISTCRSARIRTPTGEKIGFTTSVGLATSVAGDDVASLLKKADDALYAAKGNGRDQLQIASQQPVQQPIAEPA